MYDVVIIGGGLSGAALACKLADKNLNILILEKVNREKSRLPETSIKPLSYFSDNLNINPKTIESAFLNCMSVCYLSSSPHEKIFIEYTSNPEKGPFHINRSKLDSLILEEAIKKGIECKFNYCVNNILFNAKSVEIDCNIEKEKYKIHAKYVVDASGKQACIANQLDLKNNVKQLDNRQTVFSHFENPEFFEKLHPKSISILEIKNGYIFIIPISYPRFSMGVVSQDSVSKGIDHLFRSSIETVSWLKAIIVKSKQVIPFIPAMNESFSVTQPCGDRYIIIGEALGFQDPFYSNGVVISIQTALFAAEKIINLFNHNQIAQENNYIDYVNACHNHENQSSSHWFDAHGFSVCSNTLTDPHVPYPITYFLTKLIEREQHVPASKLLTRLRNNFSHLKVANYAVN